MVQYLRTITLIWKIFTFNKKNLIISEYRRSLEHDLKNELSGHFKRLMISLCCANRDETSKVDCAVAVIEAKKLIEPGKFNWIKFLKYILDLNIKNKCLL